MSGKKKDGRPGRPNADGIVPSRLPASTRDDLVGEVVRARLAEHRSVPNMAGMAGVTTAAIRRLEDGRGPVATLVAVMEALPFQLTGLAAGTTLAEQLGNRRAKLGLSIEAVAARASLSPREVVALEDGGGKMRCLLRLLAVIAPKVRRRAPERAYWGADRKADRDSRFTPPSFMEPVHRAFGTVSLDPCGHRSSPVVARRRFLLDKGADGLRDAWSGRFVFVNPPFSAQLRWLRRAHEQWEAGNVGTVLCLVPARTDSAFFQDEVRRAADIYFLRGRVPFLDEAGRSQVTPFSLMLVAFGATIRQRAIFAAEVPGFWVPASDGRRAMSVTRHPYPASEPLVGYAARHIVLSDCRPRPVYGPGAFVSASRSSINPY